MRRTNPIYISAGRGASDRTADHLESADQLVAADVSTAADWLPSDGPLLTADAQDAVPVTVSRVAVNAPFQVAFEGVVYRFGESAEVPEDVAAEWIRNGWVTDGG